MWFFTLLLKDLKLDVNKQQNRLETDHIRHEPLPNIIKKLLMIKWMKLERIYFKESPIAHGQMTIDIEVKYNALNQKKLLEDLMCLDNFQFGIHKHLTIWIFMCRNIKPFLIILNNVINGVCTKLAVTMSYVTDYVMEKYRCKRGGINSSLNTQWLE